MSVVILIPSTDFVPIEFAVSLVLGVSNTRVKTSIITNKAPGIDLSRNALVINALNTDAEYFLFWDTDVIPFKYTEDGKLEPFTGLVQYMYDLAESKKEKIVSGVYFGKNGMPTIFSVDMDKYIKTGEIDWKPYGIVLGKQYYVDAIGLGLALIHRSVFEDLEYPWFKYIFDYKDGKIAEISEDIYFSLNARKRGYRILVDTSIFGKHVVEGYMLHDGRVEVIG